tara:strand:+ start:610 stop:912 length:303 start_codon:yes stop_codon:yes gene_type:complete
MIKQNIENDKIKFQNLYKSFFSDLNNTSIEINTDKISITETSLTNSDPAAVELEFKQEQFCVSFWDGYSLAEIYETKNYKDALTKYKKFAKKLAKNLRRY